MRLLWEQEVAGSNPVTPIERLVMDIKSLIKDTEAVFSHCCKGICYYTIDSPEGKYQIGIDSTSGEWDTTYLLPKFKSINLMRWIRKSIDDGSIVKLS